MRKPRLDNDTVRRIEQALDERKADRRRTNAARDALPERRINPDRRRAPPPRKPRPARLGREA